MKLLNALSILQNLYTGVIWVNSDYEILWVNSQTEQLLSISKSRLVSKSIIDILQPNKPDLKAKNNKSIDSNDTSEEPHKKGNTKKGSLKTNKNPLTNSNDLAANARKKLETQFHNAKEYQQPFLEYSRYIHGVTYPLYVHYSVTPVECDDQMFFLIEIWQGDRQNRLDKEQRLQEQHDVSREMLRSVAHEVKNPLAGIRGAAQLLKKQTRNTKKYKKDKIDEALKKKNIVAVDAEKLTTYADIVINESDRLTNLIEQLLGSNQLPNLSYINIHEPLEHVLLLTQTRFPKVKIHRDYDLSLPDLMADKDQLIQVFLNLVNNACEAMQEQDVTKISEDYRPKLKIISRIEHQYTIGTVHHKQVLKVSVVDNGPGIDDDLIDRIFFPLVTGRASGTGLGLALVQEIVHRHQGSIDVESEPGRTQFNIYLPFEAQKRQSFSS